MGLTTLGTEGYRPLKKGLAKTIGRRYNGVMRCKRETVLKRVSRVYLEVKSATQEKKRHYPSETAWPTGCCWIMCQAMRGQLAHPKGWRVEIASGLCHGIGHHWLTLNDGTIIDPTYGQFGFEDRLYVFPVENNQQKMYNREEENI